MAKSTLFLNFFFILLLAGATSCAPQFQSNSLGSSLNNRGAVTLSAEDPYVPTNIFLAEQSERFPLLKQFLLERGGPDALEVETPLLGNSLLHLYYLASKETFQLVKKNESWFIGGPFEIPAATLTTLQSSGAKPKTMPVLLTAQQLAEYQPQQPSAAPPVKKKAASPEQTSVSAIDDVPIKRLSATPPTPTQFPDEDVTHQVKFEGESFSVLAAWYTGDAENAQRLARINGIKNPGNLKLNQKIRIPRYLLKTPHPPTKAELRKLLSEPQ